MTSSPARSPGRARLIERIRHKANLLGGALDPHAAFLFKRGLKTLALRVRFQNDSTLRVATFLAGHAQVKRVYYPGLPSHPQHARARELFAGCGGVLSFELHAGVSGAEDFAARVRIPAIAPSLGRRAHPADTARHHLACRPHPR